MATDLAIPVPTYSTARHIEKPEGSQPTPTTTLVFVVLEAYTRLGSV